MKNTFLKIIGGTMSAILLVTLFTQIFVSAQDNNNEESNTQIRENAPSGNADRLEGVWNVQVTRLNCQTGAVLGTSPSMLTFARGGTMHDFGTGRPPSTRSPGYGVWSVQSGLNYTSAFQFFIYNADGTHAGRQIVRQQIQLNPFHDTWTATTTAQVFDAGGNVIMNNCSTGTATRFE